MSTLLIDSLCQAFLVRSYQNFQIAAFPVRPLTEYRCSYAANRLSSITLSYSATSNQALVPLFERSHPRDSYCRFRVLMDIHKSSDSYRTDIYNYESYLVRPNIPIFICLIFYFHLLRTSLIVTIRSFLSIFFFCFK